ncbi:MAG: hypothetical protein BHV65_02090 [Alistipes sp. 58_9_plus]|nr:MAG: hypothetical protein BHV65_02090 [Alistipes sp. 58_9_plus]
MGAGHGDRVDAVALQRFAGGERDENLIDEELLETEIPLDDRIPDAAHEDAENDRPVYDEEGYRYDPGGE